MQKNNIRSFLAIFAIVFVSSFAGIAQTAPQNFPNVKIKNFGQMDERYYRGGQPEKGDYSSLKKLGVTTVIDLRNDPTDYEKAEVEALGMRYVNIPMSGWRYPKARSIEQFLELMNKPETGIVFVHCKAGKHRTGVTGAVYRFTKYGWDFEKAYKEMKNYNFTTWLVHGRLKDFVEDYSENLQTKRTNVSETQKASQTVQ